MKINQAPVVPTFVPVVITLENQDELDKLTNAVAKAPFSYTIQNLWQALKEYGGNPIA